MRKNLIFYQDLVKKCYEARSRKFIFVSEEELVNNSSLVEEYIDIIADEFSAKGLQEDWEPNDYGLELEEALDYYLKISYRISESDIK